MYKVAFKNLGCKVNSYEVEIMRNKIPHNFYEVKFKEEADVYIINTCSVTHVADKKSRLMIHQAKKRNKNAFIVVCGCFVDNLLLDDKCKNQRELIKNVFEDNVDNESIIFIDNANKEMVWKKVCDVIQRKEDKENNIINKILRMVGIKKHYIELNNKKEKDFDDDNIENDIDNEKVRAFIKIEDGCNNFCSYCLIPYLRGRIQSRKLEDIIADVKNEVRKGKKEIVLTGIDINAYGKDIEKTTLDSKKNELKTNYFLLDVIKEVCKVDDVLRVRIGSLHPLTITDAFVKELKKEDKFCQEFHLSLQSGSDEVLKNMNRKYTTKDYEKAVKIIRKYYKNATITTDIIVGFPMESDKNFDETCRYVKKIKFYNPHIFKYSIRKGTNASKMSQVDEKVKDKREKELIILSKKISDDIRKKQTGKTKEVLVEEIKKIGEKYLAVGFSKEYMKIGIKLDENRKDIVGKLIQVKLDGKSIDSKLEK